MVCWTFALARWIPSSAFHLHDVFENRVFPVKNPNVGRNFDAYPNKVPILQNWGILSLRLQVTFSIQQKNNSKFQVLVPQCFSMCRVERCKKKLYKTTLPKTNMCPENWWLEDVFLGDMLVFQGVLQKVPLSELIRLQGLKAPAIAESQPGSPQVGWDWAETGRSKLRWSSNHTDWSQVA